MVIRLIDTFSGLFGQLRRSKAQRNKPHQALAIHKIHVSRVNPLLVLVRFVEINIK